MTKRWAAWKVEEAWTLHPNIDELGLAHFQGRDGPVHYVTEEETDELLNGEPATAEARARKAIAADASDSQARLLLGAVLRKQKRFEEARSVLEPLAEIMPHKSLVWQELGLALAPLGEREKAIGAFVRAIDLHYMDRTSWFWLGDLLDFETTEVACSASVATAPDPPLAQAQSAYREARYEDVETIARELLVDFPDNPAAMRLLADALIRTNRATAGNSNGSRVSSSMTGVALLDRQRNRLRKQIHESNRGFPLHPSLNFPSCRE